MPVTFDPAECMVTSAVSSEVGCAHFILSRQRVVQLVQLAMVAECFIKKKTSIIFGEGPHVFGMWVSASRKPVTSRERRDKFLSLVVGVSKNDDIEASSGMLNM